jgi:hypothetical protein
MAKNSVNNRVKGLKPFKEGESGNPNGRPLGQRNYATIYREALIKLASKNGMEPDDLETELLEKAILSARKGDHRFYKDLIDRLYGTAVNKTDMTGSIEIKGNAIMFADFKNATDSKPGV